MVRVCIARDSQKKDLSVTGIDISSNSIAYAGDSALKKGLDVRYVCGNYLDMDFSNEFDTIFMIWWDFCVLSYKDRAKVLGNFRRALKPEGYFVFDVSTPLNDAGKEESSSWKASDSGFFAAGPHVVFENRFNYPKESTSLTQYVVATETDMKVYRIYHTNYTRDSIIKLLVENGFTVVDIFEDLSRTPYSANSLSMGIFATKM